MSKLYIFGIGGTGSRVIKAITMLFASGIKLQNNFDTVVPIIIDPDIANGDLNRTKEILKLYQEIRNNINNPDDFYGQEIKTIHNLTNNTNQVKSDWFQFQLKGVDQNTFNQYIGFNNLSQFPNDDDKNFVRLLFSASNLNSALDVGFKGNPNMGAIVLNQFIGSDDFNSFCQNFQGGDAIFIVNSIFGGTGAAGFPLLLKNLRGNTNITNATLINNSKIGGITYLPYFTLTNPTDGKGVITPDSFDEKAKAAIDYYNRTIISNNKINSLYFIGNQGNINAQTYAEGGPNQKNNAHFLELAGALAIVDFCKNIGGQLASTQVKEFGIQTNASSIQFTDLDISDSKLLSGPLTKFKLFTEYLNKGLFKALNTARWTKSDIKLVSHHKQSFLDENYFNSAEYKTQITPFNQHFDDWLNEMAFNQPAFSPFNSIDEDNALSLVKGKEPKGNKSFKAIDIENCRLTDDTSIRSVDQKHTMLIKMFSQSTKIVGDKKNII